MTITPAEFAEQRSPRRGSRNPERMSMKVWEWLVRAGVSAYTANEQFGGPSAIEVGPGWCFDRFGCSETRLPDGRVLHIGGEHEDYYDPDFYIYNDVIVRRRDGEVEIYGYPAEVFPPTDFHSATLVGDRIYVIGNLGYQDDRRPGLTGWGSSTRIPRQTAHEVGMDQEVVDRNVGGGHVDIQHRRGAARSRGDDSIGKRCRGHHSRPHR